MAEVEMYEAVPQQKKQEGHSASDGRDGLYKYDWLLMPAGGVLVWSLEKVQSRPAKQPSNQISQESLTTATCSDSV